jgi:squalene-hopene/tetraprenyl-beta-curcumene cyclase
VLRAFVHWLRATDDGIAAPRLRAQTRKALRSGFRYLDRVQRSDGSWLPLWFGSQFATNDENPTYGTARVLAAYRDGDRLDSTQARQARDWLTRAQNDDGGWSGVRGGNSTVEETAIAVDALLSTGPVDEHSVRGLGWILERIESGTWSEPAPIGFYFAKLWYFERLYPQIFAAAALRTAERIMKFPPRSAECPAHNPNPAVSTAAMSRR